MSKEKFYAVKDDEGRYLLIDGSMPWWNDKEVTAIKGSPLALAWAKSQSGHVVTLTEEQKVKLPQEVGKELEDWLETDSVDDILDDLVCVWDGDHDAVRNWWNSTLDATYLIADMARYGWEAEPEAKWYVQTPKEWWEDSAIPEWMHFDTCRGVCSGFSKLGRTSFTRAELKQYHLDSDIFTLVSVGEEK